MHVHRRTFLGAGLAAAAATLAGCGDPSRASWTAPGVRPGAGTSPGTGPTSAGPTPSGTATPSASPTVPPGSPVARLVFTPGRMLRKGTPAQYGAALGQTVTRYLKPTAENPKHPGYAGAVVLVVVDGVIRVHSAYGDALRYGVGPVELPLTERVAMRPDSIFDIASVTKVFTALLVLQQAEKGRVDLGAPVAEYLPEFGGTGKTGITPAMVLAHTSGLPVGISLSGLTTQAARRTAILTAPLLTGAKPGDTFRYSGLGLMVLALLVENVTGQPLDAAVRSGLTGPLGLRDTEFRPLDRLTADEVAARMVATDARPIRGLLRGVVHDGIAHTLGGIAGHAGMFSTAADLAVLGQMLINGGEYGGRRILAEATVRRMLVNANVGLPAIDAERPFRTSTHGLGVELDQPWFMGRLAAPLTFGHMGFTGVSLVVDPHRRVVLVLLTNRAHPDWTWADPDPTRAAIGNVLADAL